MSVADDFANLYIAYLRNDDDDLNFYISTTYDPEDIHEVIVALYWRISNAYDLRYHRPLNNDLERVILMDYNIRMLLESVYDDYENNNCDVLSTVACALHNGDNYMILDVPDEFRRRYY